LNFVDTRYGCEKLGIGLRGGDVSPYNARGYEQSAQAKALRCTKAKGAIIGAFCLGGTGELIIWL